MKKLLLFILAMPLLSLSCNKKNQTPEEYFSFYADGKEYKYRQDVKHGFGTSRKAIFAIEYESGECVISGSNFKKPGTPGELSFYLSENNLLSQGTIILDGKNNTVGIGDFLKFGDAYELRQPLTGKIIFTERTPKRLTGTFEFDAFKMKDVGMNWEPTDTVLHITKGKFSIIPSL